MRVKICGLTRSRDVTDACDAGADALGFVFARSPRQLDAEQAKVLTRTASDGIIRVGLFMNQTAAEVAAVVSQVPLDLLQFHGSESNEFCAAFGLPFIKAVGMGGTRESVAVTDFPDASGLLLDSHSPGGSGGSGKTFDWERATVPSGLPIWLAGGLNPDNVAAAIQHFRPWAVDVSSGVEQSPGIKSKALIEAFIREAGTA